ncbi:hypothetical protein Tco_1030680 [Tanacetum coccineum]|uniref:Uncharacterized protein n=1 Tax=Tanacetum coccineum TaxID=301880 RepID=A0ABQ5G731_9ASTR
MQKSSTLPSASPYTKAKRSPTILLNLSLFLMKYSDPEQLGGYKDKTRPKIPHARFNNDNQSGQIGNQREDTVQRLGNSRPSGSATKWDTCFNFKGFDTMPGMQEAEIGLKTTRNHKEKMRCQTSLNKVFHFKLSKLIGQEDTDEENDNRNRKHITATNWQRFRGLPEESSSTGQPLEQEKDDSKVIPDSIKYEK